jgi:hypothetical protein
MSFRQRRLLLRPFNSMLITSASVDLETPEEHDWSSKLRFGLRPSSPPTISISMQGPLLNAWQARQKRLVRAFSSPINGSKKKRTRIDLEKMISPFIDSLALNTTSETCRHNRHIHKRSPLQRNDMTYTGVQPLLQKVAHKIRCHDSQRSSWSRHMKRCSQTLPSVFTDPVHRR